MNHGEVDQRQDGLGVEAGGGIEGLQGLGELLSAIVKVSQVVVGGPVIRPGQKGSQQFLGSFRQAALISGAQKIPGAWGQGTGGPDTH